MAPSPAPIWGSLRSRGLVPPEFDAFELEIRPVGRGVRLRRASGGGDPYADEVVLPNLHPLLDAERCLQRVLIGDGRELPVGTFEEGAVFGAGVVIRLHQ